MCRWMGARNLSHRASASIAPLLRDAFNTRAELACSAVAPPVERHSTLERRPGAAKWSKRLKLPKPIRAPMGAHALRIASSSVYARLAKPRAPTQLRCRRRVSDWSRHHIAWRPRYCTTYCAAPGHVMSKAHAWAQSGVMQTRFGQSGQDLDETAPISVEDNTHLSGTTPMLAETLQKLSSLPQAGRIRPDAVLFCSRMLCPMAESGRRRFPIRSIPLRVGRDQPELSRTLPKTSRTR